MRAIVMTSKPKLEKFDDRTFENNDTHRNTIQRHAQRRRRRIVYVRLRAKQRHSPDKRRFDSTLHVRLLRFVRKKAAETAASLIGENLWL